MRGRLLLDWCLITALAVGVIGGLLASRASDRLDSIFYDTLVGLRAPPPSPRILLVTIDDHSLATIGRWPWPRSVHARLLERLAAARPAAIAYDVLFNEPAPGDEDAQLAAAIGAAGNVVLPVLFEAPGSEGRAIDATPPLAPIARAARTIGQVALLPDSDGIARSLPLFVHGGDRVWPHLMEATYRIANGRPSPIGQQVEGGGDPRILVPFQPRSGGFRTISAASVLADEVPANFLHNRIILVGVTGSGLGDRFRVPSLGGELISGVELQANLLNSLLADRMIRQPGEAMRIALSLVPTLILLVAFWWLRPARALPVAIGLIGLAIGIPILLLLSADLWLPPTASIAGLLLVYPLWGWRRLQAIDRAIGQELIRFAGEPTPPLMTMPLPAPTDPIGGQVERLRAAIANIRDLRRLVTDTMDGFDDPVLVVDFADHVIFANRAAITLFGGEVAQSDLASLPAGLAGLVPDPEAPPVEFHLGQDRTFALHWLALCDHAGEQRGWILHLADISDIRRAQQEREETLEFLSHDMRSPQSAIITLLERHGGVIQNPGLADRISALARRTLGLADNFVQMARLSAADFVAQDVDLADLLTEAADQLWPFATQRNVRVLVEAGAGDADGAGDEDGEESCYISGERDALGRALVNLIDNAVKFSPQGGVVHCAVRRIEAGTRIECVIEDEGPGIAAERREGLFARFGHRQHVGRMPSAGLGLAYVGAAVARHRGTITCEPRVPHGTRFVLRFPAIE